MPDAANAPTKYARTYLRQVWPRPATILVPDVALTDVAGQYDDLLGRLKHSGLAVPHEVSPAARVQPTLPVGRGAVETVFASWWSTGARGTE